MKPLIMEWKKGIDYRQNIQMKINIDDGGN